MSNSATVVGWDGSAAAQGALEWAADHTARIGGELHLVQVLLQEASRDPAAHVAEARAALGRLLASLGAERPLLATSAELVVGDPAIELDRIAGRDRLLVLGASTAERIPRPDARRIPTALAARPGGVTAVIPLRAPSGRTGVLGAVTGRGRSRAAIDLAASVALERHEPLTLLRLHDPHDLVVDQGATHVEDEIDRIRSRVPDLEVRLGRGWVSSPASLLTRADAAAVLVLEGRRPSAAPPRYSFERWLAARVRNPFVVVAEGIRPQAVTVGAGDTLALAV